MEKPKASSASVIPEKDMKGHNFLCVHNDGKTLIWACSICDKRTATKVPYDGLLVDPCSGSKETPK